MTGLREGLQDAFSGFNDGFDGVFEKPAEGAKQEGVRGFLKGGLRGIGGAILKPTTGAFDLLSKTSLNSEKALQGGKTEANAKDAQTSKIRANRPLVGSQMRLVEYTPLQAIAFAYYRKHFVEKQAHAFQGFVLLTVDK